jgi:nucleoside 2-deoxyribosyltransferase
METPQQQPGAVEKHRRCYVASPLGFDEAGRYYYSEVLIPALRDVVAPIDPWAMVDPADLKRARSAETLDEFWLKVGRENAKAIRSCPLLVAVLDGQEPDSGTVVELGYAAGLGKQCFGLRSDLRQCGEEGVTINLQVQTLITDSRGEIASSLERLVAMLRRPASTEDLMWDGA